MERPRGFRAAREAETVADARLQRELKRPRYKRDRDTETEKERESVRRGARRVWGSGVKGASRPFFLSLPLVVGFRVEEDEEERGR